MIGEMSNHLWQTTVFAAAAALLALAFRNNRAQVRHWLWLSASLKFLAPFSLLVGLGSRLWNTLSVVKVGTGIPAPTVTQTVVQISEPFSTNFSYAPSSLAHTNNWIPATIACLWAFGFLCVALMRLRGWMRIRTVLRASRPIEVSATVPVRSAPGLIEPGVVGVLHPVLLLPEGIAKSLTPAQFETVLAHEKCHIQRRDNLTSAMHMLVEAVFWFHPIVWWIGAKLIEERERACDEAVLVAGSEPQVYAEGILSVCKSYLESPLSCVSGVTGSDLKKRIRAIMTGRVAGELNFARKVALVIAGTAAIAVPVLVGVIGTPTIRAQSAAARPKFDVASIRACKPGEIGGGGRPGSGSTNGPSPGRLEMPCFTVEHLIETAYVEFPNGRRQPDLNFRPLPIEGGPAWVHSDNYQIQAETEVGSPNQFMMRGPMLQTLLEDRFQLRIRRETRNVPVYELTVAKGGLKLPAFDGSCIPRDQNQYPPPPGSQVEPGKKPPCNIRRSSVHGPNITIDARGVTLDNFSKYLSTSGLGRLFVDKTGITDRFNIHLEFAADETMPELLGRTARTSDAAGGTAPDPAEFPSILTAFEEVGLKLVPAEGPGDFIEIEHVERPSEN